jgi:hypothetical protein
MWKLIYHNIDSKKNPNIEGKIKRRGMKNVIELKKF